MKNMPSRSYCRNNEGLTEGLLYYVCLPHVYRFHFSEANQILLHLRCHSNLSMIRVGVGIINPGLADILTFIQTCQFLGFTKHFLLDLIGNLDLFSV